MNIYVTEPKEISAQALALLTQAGHLVADNLANMPASTVEGLFIRTYTKVDSSYLTRFPALKYIIRAGAGLDNIDLAECEKRAIAVLNSPGSNALSVAEYSLTMMLTLLKNIPFHVDGLKNGLWRDRRWLGTELSGKTVGLVGCGAVGRELSRLLVPFQVKLLGYDKYADPKMLSASGIEVTSLPELLRQSDLVSLQIPLTPESTDLFGEKEFGLMPSHSLFVNVSRGELVEEDALISALTKGVIAGAALDVTRGEPKFNPRLLSVPNLVLTPHIAGFTCEADYNIAVVAAENFLKHLEVNQ